MKLQRRDRVKGRWRCAERAAMVSSEVFLRLAAGGSKSRCRGKASRASLVLIDREARPGEGDAGIKKSEDGVADYAAKEMEGKTVTALFSVLWNDTTWVLLPSDSQSRCARASRSLGLANVWQRLGTRHGRRGRGKREFGEIPTVLCKTKVSCWQEGGGAVASQGTIR